MFLGINLKSYAYIAISFLSIVVTFPDKGYTSENDPAIQTEIIATDKIVQDSEDIKKATEIINQYINREGEQLLLDIIKNDQPGKEKALFLLGRLYKEEKAFDRAEEYLLKAYEAYPLLNDYVLKSLLEVYIATGRYKKVIETAPLIKSSLLMPNAKNAAISSLLILGMDKEAIIAMSDYIRNYPDDWEAKLTLATLLNIEGEINESISLYKDIYLNAVPLSKNALSELKVLEADNFSREEILKRADNLFDQHLYRKAEDEYNEVLKTAVNNEEKYILINSIAMCQFRTKRYDESAKSFGLIDTPEAMYWQARSFFRTNNHDAFSKIKTTLEEKYPDDKHIALLLLMEAEEFQRRGKSFSAASNYKDIIKRFPNEAENAFWGLGWMNYINGDYKTALNYFSELAAYEDSKDFYKYLFWEAKAKENIFHECKKLMESHMTTDSSIKCNSEEVNSFHGLPSDESYYGYLIKLRTSYAVPDKITMLKPDMPVNETNNRIDALSSLGMKDDAANEVANALKTAGTNEDILYLGFMAMSLGKYKDIIYHAEPKDEKEFLPYSYPLAYWDMISKAAEKGKMDAYLVAALIREESRFDPEVVSWAGAVGLMQLMPSTARRITKDAGIIIDIDQGLFDPENNILLGTYYLASLINEFNELPIAIISYNAGENIVNKWLEKYYKDDISEFIENIPYKETRRYVKKVLKSYWQYRSINGLPIPVIQNKG